MIVCANYFYDISERDAAKMMLVPRGHNYTLPVCHFQLF
jgi:hypothetical protein